MITNELLYYGGLAAAGTALAAGAVYAVCAVIYKIKLNAVFDKEYGEKTKRE